MIETTLSHVESITLFSPKILLAILHQTDKQIKKLSEFLIKKISEET